MGRNSGLMTGSFHLVIKSRGKTRALKTENVVLHPGLHFPGYVILDRFVHFFAFPFSHP